MKDTQDSLEKMTQDLANIAKVITAITTAVKVGSELAVYGGVGNRISPLLLRALRASACFVAELTRSRLINDVHEGFDFT